MCIYIFILLENYEGYIHTAVNKTESKEQLGGCDYPNIAHLTSYNSMSFSGLGRAEDGNH